MSGETVSVLELRLHDQLVGYVAGHSNGRNVFTLAPQYIADPSRQPLTLSHKESEVLNRQVSKKYPFLTRQRLHPVLSNLLPEGALRALVSQAMKVHPDNEFPLLGWLGGDLPGALKAVPVPVDEIPAYALAHQGKVEPVRTDIAERRPWFSLAGVQMKFSMKAREDGRYMTGDPQEPGDWIVKTPSTLHAEVPLNEFTCMSLASLAGVDIPEIKLIAMADIDSLPAINLPNEAWAYGIRRFDRSGNNVRIHAEDFAQVMFVYAHDKYNRASYEQIARLLYRQSRHGQRDAVQMAVRLLVNIMLANGDAHLKNWSIIYPDGRDAQLSPAYDIVSTRPFIAGESQFALNLGKTKEWYSVTLEHFERWAREADIPWGPVRYNLRETLNRARTLWPSALASSPMAPAQQAVLRDHWRRLSTDFRIDG